MFVSFFPRPRIFFLSALIWSGLAMALWHAGGQAFGAHLGLAQTPARAVIGVSRFWSPAFLWFYLYYCAAVGMSAAAWRLLAPHPWWRWSILGSALIIFVTFLQVQVSVAINDWYGPFYDLIQAALSHTAKVGVLDLYRQMLVFAEIAVAAVVLGVLTLFFASHYVFRWRTAMNGFYMSHWSRLRGIEGASQRVQEDTMRFSLTTEDLGVSFVNAVLTLLAFIPVLIRLSRSVTRLPLLGAVPDPLMLGGIGWALLGTAFLAAIGVRLPGLQFRNQRVEAALRKELVLGEDDAQRADPVTVAALFENVRRNYF